MDRPHGNIQSPSEMLATANERRMNSKIYNRTSENGEVVNAIVSQLAADLAEMPKKADLRDPELVKRVCITYIDACSKAGTIPTKIGLARALGMSRRTVDYFLERHPEHESAQVLELVFDAFSEAMSTAALAGAVQQVYAIFLSKAIYGYQDTVTIKSDPPDPLDYKRRTEEILARWSKEDLSLLPSE